MAIPISSITIEDIIKYDNFQLSIRGKINEKKIKSLILPKEIPLIIDISIMGYSTNKFDIEVQGVKFSEFTEKCIKKTTSGDTLTIKRACRVCRFETNNYIKENKIITPLFKQYSSEKTNILTNEFSFIGGEHLVPMEICKDLYNLWLKFDLDRKTDIAKSVKRVLEAKYGDIDNFFK